MTETETTLGTALASLSESATGLGSELQALNDAVDNLQISTAQCGENQRTASESLAKAATELSPASEPTPSTQSSANSWSAATDD